MSLYQALVEAGVEVSNRYSDLYFPVNETTEAILATFPKEKSVTKRFKSEVNGEQTYETPFSFDPYWENKLKKDGPDVSHL